MHYHPLTAEDRKEMLQTIGAREFEDLLKGIPEKIRAKELAVAEATSELELRRLLAEIGRANKTSANTLSFVGGGSYEHFIPAALPQILGRHESCRSRPCRTPPNRPAKTPNRTFCSSSLPAGPGDLLRIG